MAFDYQKLKNLSHYVILYFAILVLNGCSDETSKLEKLGYNGIDTGSVHFDNTRVPADNLIGLEEGKGLQQVLAGLELGRINVAARGVGVARGLRGLLSAAQGGPEQEALREPAE